MFEDDTGIRCRDIEDVNEKSDGLFYELIKFHEIEPSPYLSFFIFDEEISMRQISKIMIILGMLKVIDIKMLNDDKWGVIYAVMK